MKRIRKRITAMGLAVMMAASLAACGGKTGNQGTTVASSSDAGKQGVFTSKELNNSLFEGVNSYYINALSVVDDKLVGFVELYADQGYGTHYVAMDLEGNVVSDKVLYEEIYQYDTEEDIMPLDEIDAAAAATTIVEPAYDPTYSYEYIYSYQILEDGSIAYIHNVESGNWETNEFHYQVNIIFCDAEGNEINSVDVVEYLGTDENLYFNSLIPSKEGTVFATSYDYILEIDPTEGIIAKLDTNEVTQELYSPSFYKDGYPVITKWNEDYTSRKFVTIDIRNGVIVEELNLLDNMDNYTVYNGGASGYDYILINNVGVYGYNFGDQEPTLIMNYINSDLATYNFTSVAFIDEEHFIGVYSDMIDWNNHICYFTKVDPKDVPDKTALTMATYGTNSSILQQVIDFNKASDAYKIVVEDYSTYSSYEDYYAGITKLNNDILAGKVPDIICNSGNLDLSNYAAKGLFTDIYALIDNDPALNREDFCTNVLEAFAVGGKLYELPTTYSISTIVGKTSIFGEDQTLTWEKLAEVQAAYPEARVFNEMTKEDVLYQSVRYNYAALIDTANGTCDFNSDQFKHILEFCNTFPDEIDWDALYSSDDYWLEMNSQYINNKTLLYAATMYNLRYFRRNVYSSFQEDTTAVGFPNDSGIGSIINANYSYAISKKAASIDGAWEFVKTFISEEAQMPGGTYSWGLPILKKALEAYAAEMTQKPYYYNENGEKVEYDDEVWMNGTSFVVEPATEEEAQKWLNFALSVNTRGNNAFYDSMEIISEEAAAYFSGQKTVEEVAGIIQSRMGIFISEKQ